MSEFHDERVEISALISHVKYLGFQVAHSLMIFKYVGKVSLHAALIEPFTFTHGVENHYFCPVLSQF